MKKHIEPKRKVGKTMDKDIEMIERCLEKENKEFDSDDNEEGSSMRDVEVSDSRNPKIKQSKEAKSGITKSVLPPRVSSFWVPNHITNQLSSS